MSRNILVVMNSLEALEPDLKIEFKSLRNSVLYTAPELMPTRWMQLTNILQNTITENHPKFNEIVTTYNGQ